MSSSFRKGGGLKRRRPFRDVRPKIVVLCEGAVAEPTYLKGYCAELRTSLIDIRPVGGCVPKTLVERASALTREARNEARRQRDQNLSIDEIWCVFDVDDHPRIQEAKVQAKANGIKVAISNPCFELWLILHFREQTAYLDRAAAKSAWRTLSQGAPKAVPQFATCSPGYDRAVKRAIVLELRNETAGQPGENPSTTMYLLTERIRRATL